MKRISYLLSVFTVICISEEVVSQDNKISDEGFSHDEYSKKSAFESTMWMPNRGVKLLKDDYALEVWKSVQDSNCYIPKLNDENLRSFNVFQTQHLNIFLFSTWAGSDWTVCQRKSNKQEFQAGNLSGGYQDGDPKNAMGNCSSGSSSTKVRFRSYRKDGPLLLEVYLGGCRGGEAHHEFLFRLDKEELEEIPGSRLVMNDYYNFSENEGWMWMPHKRYSRFGHKSWNENGDLSWTRKLQKHPLIFVTHNRSVYDYHKASVFELKCKYHGDAWKVACEEQIITSVSLDFGKIESVYNAEPNRYEEKEYYRTVIKKINWLKSVGYHVKQESREQMEARILRLESSQKK